MRGGRGTGPAQFSSRLLLAGAAAGLLATACTTEVVVPPGFDPSATPSADDTTPTASPSPTPTTSTGLPTLGEPVDLGGGTVAGVTRDGTGLLVMAPVPGSTEMGCEGTPFEILWIVDVETGERRRALDVAEADHPFVTSALVGPESQAVLWGSCEGFLGDVVVAQMRDDGTVDSWGVLPMPPVDLAPWTLHLVPDSRDIVLTGQADFETAGVYVVSTITGDWIDIDDRPLTDWIPLPDGQAVELVDDTLSLVDEEGAPVTSFPADDFIAGPAGLPGLAFRYGNGTDDGEVSLLLPDGVREVVSETDGFGGSVSPDGRLVAWSTYDPDRDVMTTVIHEVETGETVEVEGVYFAGIHWLEGGIAHVAEGPGDAFGFAEPIVWFRPFA